MIAILKSRYGGSWDGEKPEVHGLLSVGGRKLKVELLFVKATGRWQCCVFEQGECVVIDSGENAVELVAKAIAVAL